MIQNEKGNVTITVLVFCVLLFAAMLLVTDIAKLYSVKVSARQGLNLALRGAADQLCPDRLGNFDDPRAVILPSEAEQVFVDLLKENLRLDENLNPSAGSIADGRVEVEFFCIVNSEPSGEDHPAERVMPYSYTYSYEGESFTEQIDQVSATGIIRVPVELSSLANVVGGLPKTVDIYVHSTAGPQLISQKE